MCGWFVSLTIPWNTTSEIKHPEQYILSRKKQRLKASHSKTSSGFTVSFRTQEWPSKHVWFLQNYTRKPRTTPDTIEKSVPWKYQCYWVKVLWCHDVILFYCLGFSVVNVAFGLVILALAILRVCCYLLFLSLDYKYNVQKAKFCRI